MPDILNLIERSLVEDPPMTIREGGIIKKGYDAELDELISISTDGKKWLAALEEKERKRTGINSLKVGFNSVFGYYIEITKANSDLVPDDYIRKQTLVNAERYINQELKGYEYTVLSAEDRRKVREYDLFVGIRDKILQEIARIQQTASHIACLDACSSLAEVAERYSYCCPLIDCEDKVDIKNGRHPVVERMPLPDDEKDWLCCTRAKPVYERFYGQSSWHSFGLAYQLHNTPGRYSLRLRVQSDSHDAHFRLHSA